MNTVEDIDNARKRFKPGQLIFELRRGEEKFSIQKLKVIEWRAPSLFTTEDAGWLCEKEDGSRVVISPKTCLGFYTERNAAIKKFQERCEQEKQKKLDQIFELKKDIGRLDFEIAQTRFLLK